MNMRKLPAYIYQVYTRLGCEWGWSCISHSIG